VVLVLDDFHVIASQEIAGQLGYLLDRLPQDVHLVVASQTEPALRLGRLRAMGDLAELRDEQLRFTEEETAALLNRVHGLDLSPAQLGVLQDQTEGWVAGLNLAALSLQRPGDRERVLSGLPADDRFLVDYLWNEVVLGQPRDVRHFLMRTSILERLTSSLCDAVAERSDSDETLRDLERANLFVVPLDSTRGWFRYHHLFRELLRGQLERVASDLVPDLHRRASLWYAERGFKVEAIDHAIAAGDVHYAADELVRHWLELYSAGQAAAVLDLIDRVPAETIDHPTLALVRAGIARRLGRIDEFEPWIARAEPIAARSRAEVADRIASAVAALRCLDHLAEGDVPGAIGWAQRAIDVAPESSPEHARANCFMAIALFFEEPDKAEPLLRGCLDSGEVAPRRYYVMALLAQTHVLRGEIDEAERLVHQSLDLARANGLEEYSQTGQVHVALGAVLLAGGDPDGAEEQLDRAAMLSHRGGDRVETAHALVWLARARADQRDAAGAKAARDAAREAVPSLCGSALQRLAAAIERDIGIERSGSAAAQEGEPLSESEVRVLRLLSGDLTYREIGRHLYLSVNTVRTYAQRIRRKLGVSTRAGAVACARQLGLI
jgi:LuxR family maltose regulon positive regulatory protein